MTSRSNALSALTSPVFHACASDSVDEGKSPPIPYVYVNSSGSVKNYRPIQVVLACSLELYAFPFDKQNCSLTFRSWLHSGLCSLVFYPE